ncbi:DUF551 domain-containing protein [Lacrimispora sp.]|uniref:DUF551 domain-containing protein n=1 Tax=Lacrimispora sp. TaxID=2719234 RepID=UPI0028AAD8D2|nr:DUF551 domain-containing protein [Lacrimispora sp.]
MEANWISILEQEPKDVSGRGTYYLVTVKCGTWDRKCTTVMKWCEETVDEEINKSWEWEGRIKSEEWEVTHWSKFPRPAED